MPSTIRCPRCAAMLPGSAQYCRRCGAAQGQSTTRATPPPIQSPPKPGKSVQVRWFTLLGFFGLVGGGLVLMNQESPTPIPASQVAPVISPRVVDQQQIEPVYPNSSQLQRPVYPESPPPGYPGHNASTYGSHERDRH